MQIDGIMLVVIMAAVVSNFIILVYKLKHKQFVGFGADVIVLWALTYMFGGTAVGMVIATGAGAMFSLYLLMFPLDIDFDLSWD